MSAGPTRHADEVYDELSLKDGWRLTQPPEGVDGCVRIGDIEAESGSGLIARIQNVTTVHTLVARRLKWSDARCQPLVFDLDVIAEYGRCSLALAGPAHDGMPSVSTTIEQHPLLPRTTLSLHGGGKVVQTGCPSIDQALLAAHTFRNALHRVLGLQLTVCSFRAVNIVATIDTRTPIKLSILAELLGARCEYEDPEVARKLRNKKAYSGARVTSDLPREKKRAKMIIFSTGNAVFMGARSREDILFMITELEGFVARVQRRMETDSLQLAVSQTPGSLVPQPSSHPHQVVRRHVGQAEQQLRYVNQNFVRARSAALQIFPLGTGGKRG